MKDVLQELQTIEKEHGILTPNLVVKKAEDKMSPLHSHFQWDDAAAAEGYRIWQARQLIKSVKVEIKGKKIQAFYNVKVSEEGHRSYVSSIDVLSRDDYKSQVISNALGRIRHWQKQYQDVEELAEIVNEEKVVEVEKLVVDNNA